MSDPWSGHPVDPAVTVMKQADDLMEWEALIAAKPYVTCEHGRHRICIKCVQEGPGEAVLERERSAHTVWCQCPICTRHRDAIDDAGTQALDAGYEEFPHDE